MVVKKPSFWRRVGFILNLPRSLPLAWNLIKDNRLPLKNKIFFIALSLLYLIIPVDIIPDIPILGQFDDITVFLFLFNWFLKQVPKEILIQYGWEQEEEN
ncbi:MAG: DUF1232 domain-containing protein [Bacillota bacterium]